MYWWPLLTPGHAKLALISEKRSEEIAKDEKNIFWLFLAQTIFLKKRKESTISRTFVRIHT